jgi:hypothetical protein
MQSAHEGGKVVSLTHRPPLPPGSIPGTRFCKGLSRAHGHRIMSMKNSSDTIGNRSRDLPVCSAVPQPLCHRVLCAFGYVKISDVQQVVCGRQAHSANPGRSEKSVCMSKSRLAIGLVSIWSIGCITLCETAVRTKEV